MKGDADLTVVEAATSTKFDRIMTAYKSQKVQQGLRKMDSKSLTEMQARHEAQSDGLENLPAEYLSQWNREETEAYFRRTSTQDSGTLVLIYSYELTIG